MYKRMQIIAEVKTRSPFGFRAEKSWDELFEIAHQVGDIIAVHTDSRWDGSFDLLKKARARTTKPILAKGFHLNDEAVHKAINCGAGFVLVVGRIPKRYASQCLIEPYTLAELAQIPTNLKAVWNSRDLQTGGLRVETFEEARAVWRGWLCQASNIITVSDIKNGADAVLVGTHLSEFAHSLSIHIS